MTIKKQTENLKEDYKMKRKVSLAMATVMAASMAAVGSVPAAAADVSITIFNSKMEIQSQLEEKAAEYGEQAGVDIEVYYSSDTVSAHMACGDRLLFIPHKVRNLNIFCIPHRAFCRPFVNQIFIG